ncbi:hypothetical protein COB11_00660 [Candidatus Aerophobetes bacterium]|uniref:Uncharacterized protein n=1 Tax=Aerophobetes bacterium TaxID=2030807 RepID=A0A2A4YMI8_UNCAE|nr:MAG: hypothetical protein COB11_00660 [Candidatus Aerophobetes bacterium]
MSVSEISDGIEPVFTQFFTNEQVENVVPDQTELLLTEQMPKQHLENSSIMEYLKTECDYQKHLQLNRINKEEQFLTMIEKLLEKDPTVLDLYAKYVTDEQLVLLAEILPSLNISTLNLSNNTFEYTGMLALAKALPKTQVINLELRSNSGCAIDKLFQILPQTQIQKLDLYSFGGDSEEMSQKDFHALITALPESKILELDLGCSNICDHHLIYLMMTLPETKIQKLNLSENNIRMEHDELAEFFHFGIMNSDLQDLSLGGNFMGDSIAFELAKILEFSKIQKLDLSRCGITEKGVKQLALTLPLSQVKELKLGTNHLGSQGLISLSNALPSSQVQVLNLSLDQEKFNLESLEKFKEGILKSKVISLSFGFNEIGTNGARVFAEILEKGHIKTLELRCDRSIGPEGAEILANALKHSCLEKLYFSSNNIQDKGCVALAEALPFSKIKWLSLGLNGISNDSIHALIGALKTPLSFLGLEYNQSISGQSKEELIHAAQLHGVSIEL